jgi:hypothetical protein
VLALHALVLLALVALEPRAPAVLVLHALVLVLHALVLVLPAAGVASIGGAGFWARMQ